MKFLKKIKNKTNFFILVNLFIKYELPRVKSTNVRNSVVLCAGKWTLRGGVDALPWFNPEIDCDPLKKSLFLKLLSKIEVDAGGNEIRFQIIF